MSILSSVSILSPMNKLEECAQFIIPDERERYTLYDVMSKDLEFTLSFWTRSEIHGKISIGDYVIETSSEWKKVAHTFIGDDNSLTIDFDIIGTYYFYHPKLELGNISTGWSPSPEDLERMATDAQAAAKDAQDSADKANEHAAKADSLIEQLAHQISMMVTDGNGMSLMTQTKDGWTFSIASLQDTVNNTSSGLYDLQVHIGNTRETVDVLTEASKKYDDVLKYVQITTYENEPCIELGTSRANEDTGGTDDGEGKDYKLLITNTRIMFMNGDNILTYIDNDELVTENITVKSELRQGNFVWAVRGNGNYALMVKGV